MVHQPQRGGAFFMAPDKLHHVEALYSGACHLRVFFYNIRTEAIGVTHFRAFARVIPESPDEPEVLRFLTPVEDGALLGASPGDQASRPFEIELYVRFPEGDAPQLFTVRIPALSRSRAYLGGARFLPRNLQQRWEFDSCLFALTLLVYKY